jgi:hypothetical protein
MSEQFLVYKAREGALKQAFQKFRFEPRVEEITPSDMINTGGSVYASQIKISFTRKVGNYLRIFMYIPGSSVTEQHHLNDEEKAALEQWLNWLVV